MVYDCFPFMSENDLLEIRINQHWNVVDKFIVVESTQSHTGLEKPLNLDVSRFSKYSEKLIYAPLVSLDRICESKPHLLDPDFHSHRQNVHQIGFTEEEDMNNSETWKRDNVQGNYFIEILKNIGAKDDDIVFASSLDEILKEDAFRAGIDIVSNESSNLKPESPSDHLDYLKIDNWYKYKDIRTPAIIGFKLQWYLCKLNFKMKMNVAMGNLTKFLTYKRIPSTTLRHMAISTHAPVGTDEDPAGWHFYFFDSSLSGSGVKEKFMNWAHADDFVNRCADTGEVVKAKDMNPKDLVKRLFYQHDCDLVELKKETHPSYLIENIDKYRHLLAY